MLTQVTIGNDGTMVLDEWTQTPQGWLLDQDDF
jgi:precorrin-3B methylase